MGRVLPTLGKRHAALASDPRRRSGPCSRGRDPAAASFATRCGRRGSTRCGRRDRHPAGQRRQEVQPDLPALPRGRRARPHGDDARRRRGPPCSRSSPGTDIPTVDITGGAPELHKRWREIVVRAPPRASVMDRCNLTITAALPNYATSRSSSPSTGVEVVARCRTTAPADGRAARRRRLRGVDRGAAPAERARLRPRRHRSASTW
jgi:hypothetical protein